MKINKLASRFLPIPIGSAKNLPAAAWLLALPFAIVAALLMPRQSAFPYTFQVGQPWNYRDLKAPFDFEVLYPDEQVSAAIQQVNAEHGPYFLLDMEVARQQKRAFSKLLDDQITIGRHDAQYDDLRANAGVYQSFGQEMLDLLYNQGIADAQEEIFQNTPGFVLVMAGNTERKVPVRDLLTVTSALNFLTDTLPYAPLRQPEMVLPILEKVLVPNLRFSDSLTRTSLNRKLNAVRSTGLTVHKEEVIVQRNDLITNDIYLKLQSLRRRYTEPHGWLTLVGYSGLAWLTFGFFFFWFAQHLPDVPRSRWAQLFPPLLALLGVLAVGFSNRVADAVPLLWPSWALPVLLRRAYSLAVSLAVWGIVVFLTTISLPWGAGWLAIQVAGLASALVFLHQGRQRHSHATADALHHISTPYGWRARLLAVSSVAGVQTLAGIATGWADKIPEALWTTDSIVFFFAAAAFSLLAFPLGEWIARQLNDTSTLL